MASRVTPLRPDIGRTAVARPRTASRAASAGGERRAVLLLVPVALLTIVGLGALMSASSVVALRQTGDHLFYFKRQLAFVGAGIVVFVIAARVPYRVYQRFSPVLMVLAVAGLMATLTLGEIRGGARRWIDLGPVSLQASEFAKFAVVAYLASVMARRERWLGRFTQVLWPVGAAMALTAVPLLLQPDLGTTLIIAASAIGVLAVSAAPFWHVLAITGIGGFLGFVAAYTQPYRWERIVSFLDPNADPLGSGLQAYQSLVALGTGGLFGIGLGASRARWSFLPNAHTDFIFAIIGEETGLAGALVVVALFMMFAIVGASIALKAPDGFGRLLAAGIVTWLSVQALVNIGGVTRVLPITGVPLPFVSSGGSALIVNMAAAGVLVNIARIRSEPAEKSA